MLFGIDMKKHTFTIESIQNKLSPVFKNYNINSAFLFGSYAKGCATEKSDIDLLVDSNLRGLRFFALLEDVREALNNKEIDLFDVTHIDMNSVIQKEIKRTGVKIYGNE